MNPLHRKILLRNVDLTKYFMATKEEKVQSTHSRADHLKIPCRHFSISLFQIPFPARLPAKVPFFLLLVSPVPIKLQRCKNQPSRSSTSENTLRRWTMLTPLASQLHWFHGLSIPAHEYKQIKSFFNQRFKLFLATGLVWAPKTSGCPSQFVQSDGESSCLITLLGDQPNTKS